MSETMPYHEYVIANYVPKRKKKKSQQILYKHVQDLAPSHTMH